MHSLNTLLLSSWLLAAPAIAESGVDTISSGAITHSAMNLDLGLDF